MNTEKQEVTSKVLEVIWLFRIIKILATTLGETGGDALSMSLNLGYLVSTGIFAILFLLAVSIQIRAKNFFRLFPLLPPSAQRGPKPSALED